MGLRKASVCQQYNVWIPRVNIAIKDIISQLIATLSVTIERYSCTYYLHMSSQPQFETDFIDNKISLLSI
ncbi:hypothetical protein C0J52_21104 [Blattella germanica]|nr:hypothetical protein C0J52_21104 [Blattella germanica]